MITELIQDAIRNSGVTRYWLWKQTGIGQDTLCRFMQGKTGLLATSMDKILDVLELEIVIRPRRTTRKEK
jgi:hypothetical protein